LLHSISYIYDLSFEQALKVIISSVKQLFIYREDNCKKLHDLGFASFLRKCRRHDFVLNGQQSNSALTAWVLLMVEWGRTLHVDDEPRVVH
jgi:hypothetical protein